LGCIGFKAFLPFAGKDYPRVDDYQLLTGMEQLSALGSLLGVHAENDDIINGKEREFIKAGNYSGRYHEQSRPEISEIESIQKAILFAEETKCSLHICHLSTARAKEIILTAKAKGLSLTVETCPHYLCLTVSDLERLGGYAKCNPPLRTEDNRNKLWDMIKDGTIDCIASDHSPYTNEDRDVHEGNIWEMPPGIGGLELFLPLLIDEGYHKRGVPLEQIAQLTSHTPARRFGIANQKGAIEIGRDADLVIVDTEREWTFSANDSFMKAKCTKGPYEGRKIKGCVETTIVRGTIVYDGQTIQAPEGYGKMITARKGGHHD